RRQASRKVVGPRANSKPPPSASDRRLASVRFRGASRWLWLAVATAAAAVAFDRIGLPSASLFAALLVGLIAALSPLPMPAVPPGVFRMAQAITGVSLGVYVQSSSLHAVASSWLPVAFVSAGTLVLSLA